jgi:hypothetical protein
MKYEVMILKLEDIAMARIFTITAIKGLNGENTGALKKSVVSPLSKLLRQ